MSHCCRKNAGPDESEEEEEDEEVGTDESTTNPSEGGSVDDNDPSHREGGGDVATYGDRGSHIVWSGIEDWRFTGESEFTHAHKIPIKEHLIHNKRQEAVDIIRFASLLMMEAATPSILVTTILLDETKTYTLMHSKDL